MTGLVFDVFKGTTHDGPGIRNTVFFKGCPLRCAWCQNPESIEAKNRVWYSVKKCIGCSECLAACRTGALSAGADGMEINAARCAVCGGCAGACPTGALSLIAREYTVDELLWELVVDKPYFNISGGGVTLSGGEPLLQKEFCIALLRALKETDVRTALDTCGYVSSKALLEALPYTDTVLFDLKIFDSDAHAHFTGHENGKILENARLVADFIRKNPNKELWIRTPIIPDATDSDENILEIAKFIKRELSGAVSRWDLCLFNRASAFKYASLGRAWEFAEARGITSAEKERLLEVARQSSVNEIYAVGFTAE